MAQSKRFEINKVENFLKNSSGKAQTWRYWNAALDNGRMIKEIDENLARKDDNKEKAELPLGQTDALRSQERLIRAVEKGIKFKYQPQIPKLFSTMNKAMRN